MAGGVIPRDGVIHPNGSVGTNHKFVLTHAFTRKSLGAGGDDLVLDGAYPSGTCGGERPLWGRYPWDWPIAEEDYT